MNHHNKEEVKKVFTEDYWLRRRSFGIGGAGNIRNHEEATVPVLLEGNGRRRSSVWSNKSGSSVSSSPKIFDKVKNLFGSSPKESPEEQ